MEGTENIEAADGKNDDGKITKQDSLLSLESTSEKETNIAKGDAPDADEGKAAEAQWTCSVCTYSGNAPGTDECTMCNTPRNPGPAASPVSVSVQRLDIAPPDSPKAVKPMQKAIIEPMELELASPEPSGSITIANMTPSVRPNRAAPRRQQDPEEGEEFRYKFYKVSFSSEGSMGAGGTGGKGGAYP